MADITLPSPTPQSESARALRSSYICYFLATLAMCVIGWFVIEGIEATAPNSSARYAKIAGGVLQMILGGYVFSLASQNNKDEAFSLRALGWSIFALNIVMASLANYAINVSAGKDAALSNATVAEIRAQADASRKAAQTLQDSADKLNKSKHGWLNSQGGQTAAAAAQQTAAAAGAAEKLEKMRASLTSTPMIEIIGEKWTMALSIIQAVILELCNIVLMHQAGVQRRKSLVGGLPVEYQILELLQEMRRAPAAPALSLAKSKTKAIEAPQAAQEDPAEDDTAPAPARAPAADEKPAFGFIPATSKLNRFDTPPLNVNTPRKEYFLSDRGINDDTLPLSTLTPPEPYGGINVDTPDTPAKARKQRQARDGLPMDSGVGEHDGYRYRRALAGVQAHTIRPSLSGLYQGVGATADVARRYLKEMARVGEIVRNAEDTAWIPAPKPAAKKAKKGGAA